ncbi:lysosomal acid lipase [Culex quinquefasciatus]|uniref:Lipase n=1 Tax=Culex quinquefasciatus TaxID=7176 RepID=B0W6H2_CULQU|nr:lysosomal acid lipase [Culex quinquefasciatus]|eukprot:XP_001844306.1 lysosomal acid lipase [Culex quinquefasciatus]
MGVTSWWVILHLLGWMIVASGGSELEENLVEGWFNDEDTELLVPELITKYGYKVEGHTMITEDGYVLKMFRIPPKRQSMLKRKPVLLVHGVLASSADYVISGPNSSLAYLLSDNGYDVWLANVRGSRYSKEHLRLPVESKEYWDFTWHEIGYYDLPAMIDHVLNVTNSEKLFFIGHSQGTTVYFVMTSTRPEYNDKIALMTALSPVVGLQHVRSPILRFLLNNVDKIKKIFDALNIHEFMPYSDQRLPLVRALCQPGVRNNPCVRVLELVAGPNPAMLDPRLVLTYQGHFPQGASVKQMLHHAQVVNDGGRFRQFDYGWEGNWERYGSLEPPAYNLTASTAPVLIYYGLNDWMVHPRDAQRLSKQLPRVIAAVPVADRKFTHMDFMLAKNVRKELYESIFPVLEKYDRVR